MERGASRAPGQERHMICIVIGNRVFWAVDGIVFATRRAAIEYMQSR